MSIPQAVPCRVRLKKGPQEWAAELALYLKQQIQYTGACPVDSSYEFLILYETTTYFPTYTYPK